MKKSVHIIFLSFFLFSNISLKAECFGNVDFSVTKIINQFNKFEFRIQSEVDFTQVLWDFGDGNSSSELGPNHTYLGAGFYNVSLQYYHSNGCDSILFKSIFIEESSGFDCSDFNSSPTNIKNVTCFGGSNGSATITTMGGTTPYSYDWHDGTGQSLDSTLNNLSPGTYNVTVSDLNGCLDSVNFYINPPEESNLPNFDLGPDRIICSGDSTLLNAGEEWESYSWSTESINQVINVSEAGTYTATVTDFNGCENQDSITLSFYTLPDFDLGPDRTICSGDSTVLNAGEEWESYFWSTGSTNQVINVSEAGTYTATVTDFNGCENQDSITLSFYTLPDFDLGPDRTVCSGDNIVLNAGEEWESYFWSTGSTNQVINVSEAGTYTATVTDFNGCENQDSITLSFYTLPNFDLGPDRTICSGDGTLLNAGEEWESYSWSTESTNQVINVSEAGTYTATVTDFNGCENQDSITLSFNSLPNFDLGPDRTVCSGDNIVLDAGEEWESYFWSTGSTNQVINVSEAGTYTATVTDFNGCENQDSITLSFYTLPNFDLGPDRTVCSGDNIVLDAGEEWESYFWSTGFTNQVINVSEAGTYTATVTDFNGCENQDSITLSFYTLPNFDLGPDRTICLGGNALLNAGEEWESYFWSTGSTNQVINVSEAGTYTATVTDFNGCENQDSITLSFYTLPNFDLGPDRTVCSGDSTLLNAGEEWDSYSWSTESTNQVINVSEAGTYTATVTDFNGCENQDSITLSFYTLPNFDLGPDRTICLGDSTLLNAGEEWDSYSWSTESTNQVINVSEAGTYTATVTDFNGCENQDSITLSFYTLPNFDLGPDRTICLGDSTLLNAGEEWESYSWSTGSTNQVINVSEAGTYTATVTDFNGCQASENVNILVSVQDFDLGNDTTVFNLDSFSLDAGEGWTTYVWSNEETTQVITVESGGVYYVTVTNSFGCEVSDSLTVTLSSEGNCFAAFGYESDSTYVSFTNNSQGLYTDVHYDFGDGTSSNLDNPVKSYNQSGVYSVCINIFDSLTGCVSDSCYSITVLKDTSEVFCQADFEFNSIGAKKFAFYNTSKGDATDVKWEFNGGQNIVRSDSTEFEFSNSGYFEVCLSVYDSFSNCFNSICKTIEVVDTNSVNCRADFDFFIQNTGEVFFNSKALGSYSSVYFSLGDGISKDTSTFSYSYQNSGHYEVCMSVYDALSGCQDQYCEQVVVNFDTSSRFCEAKMDGFVDSENIAHAINQSIGDYTHAHWDFGDGSQSFKNSPTHEFLSSGYYNICLNIHDSVSGCQSSTCEEVNIELDSLAANCLADFEFIVIDKEVTFNNNSLGDNSHVHWSFGDGSYDDGSPVSYIYEETGVYEVFLSIWDSISGCQATVSKQVSIVKDTNTVFCLANFDYISLSNNEIQFKDASIGDYTNVHWDLGNGIFSDSTSPKGIYSSNGIYPVTVMIWDSISKCQSSYKKEIAIAIDADSVECHAKFEFFPINDSLVKFKSVSQGAYTNINWDFGDGTFSEGQSEVEHVFPHGGFFTVCVGIYDNQTGCHDLVCDNVVLLKDTTVIDCHANFEFFPTNSSEVVFNNLSEGTFTKSFWKFSTGVSSYDENPTVNFEAGGLYSACLTVFDSILGCQDKHCLEVPIINDTTSYCDAHYEFYMDSRTVNFYPEIKGNITGWIWDYDDGFNSNDSFPSHTYEEDGVYEVCLTVFDSLTGCFNTYCDEISVLGDVTQLDDYVKADFSYFLDLDDGKVYFKDESVGNPNSWYWDFGDGDSAGVSQNPSYKYTEDGFYEVCLTAKNSNNGQESKCEVITVGDVSDACYAKFDFYANAITATAHFDNNTLGRITEYNWDFGDSITSFQYQPVHSYADTGFYPVCLTVSNDSGCVRTFCNEIRVGNALENKCLIGCVWPGDANLDLEANHYDILPMGLHFGETGPNRKESSNGWRGYESQDWSSNLWGNVNNKHGDANGDGVINFSDIEIIETNFAYSHPLQPRAQAANQLSIDWDVDDIDIGETAVLTVSVPDSINVTMYGLGFEIDLDPVVFDYGTIRYDFEGSWLGTEGEDLITFGLENEDLGQIYIAESRNDHNELNGNGELVKIYVTAKANSSNTGAILTTEGGVTEEGDTVSFAGEAEEVNVNSIEERGGYLIKDLKVFPNPTTNQIIFNLPIGTNTEYKIELFDNVGALVYRSSQMNGGLVTQNLKNHESGIYIIQVSSDKVKYMQKVILMK